MMKIRCRKASAVGYEEDDEDDERDEAVMVKAAA